MHNTHGDEHSAVAGNGQEVGDISPLFPMAPTLWLQPFGCWLQWRSQPRNLGGKNVWF